MKQEWPPETVLADTSAPTTVAEITTTECPECGAAVSGLNGRYACGLCGWVNHWSQGSGRLPTAQEDPDWDGG
jgi:ribosomal protein S27AE